MLRYIYIYLCYSLYCRRTVKAAELDNRNSVRPQHEEIRADEPYPWLEIVVPRRSCRMCDSR